MADPSVLDPARSVSLQASAGSGKTWQLVSRIVRLLLEGAEPGGILALTFTRKAAIEMRLRLNERLRRLAAAPDAELDAELAPLGLAPDAALRERARGLYQALLFAPYPPRAMTLHAFAQELLARFAVEAQVPPDFTLYENEVELLDRSWRRLQARLTAEPHGPAAQALRALIDLDFNEWTLRELVDLFLAHRGDWWAYTENEPDPVAFASARLRDQLGDCDLERALQEVDAAAFTARLRMMLNYVERAGGTRYIKPEPLARALLQPGALRFDALEEALYTKSTGKPYSLTAGEGALKSLSAKEREHLLETHAEVIREFEAMRGRRHAGETLARSTAAFTLGEAALEALRDELAREHALGFTELEWKTCRLLRQDGAAEWVRYRLDRRVDHLLVDEFQDTSPTQWRMLLPLLQEMAAGEAGRARSLFIVGDAKQSIYGFRRADPRLLGRATDWMTQALEAITAPLHHSRRSAPAIIDFVNALFAVEGAGARIGFEAHGTHRADDWGRVEVAPAVADAAAGDVEDAGFRDPFERPRASREDTRARLEAQQVSARIRALVASGIEVTTQQGKHRIGWGDVMVLARARTHLHHLERQLTADGVPFVGAARGTLLQTSIARDLTALLRLLDSPHRSLDLAQALRSPLLGGGDAQLVALAADVRAHGGGWLDALARLAPADPVLGRAHALVSAWRAQAARLPAHDLLDRIARDTDAAARYEAALPPVTAARARANLGAFLQLALEADSGRYPSLPRFLQWLDAQERAAENAPDEPPPAAATEQVRIMTIHAAKGLEAPAVFLYNAGSAQSPRSPRLLIAWPEDAGRPTHFAVAGPVQKLDALGRSLGEAHKARETDEELHVLYVAATRARHFLHVSGFQTKASKTWHGYALRAIDTLERASPLPGTAQGSLCYAVGRMPAAAVPAPAPAAAPADPRLRRPLGKNGDENGDAHLYRYAPSQLDKGARPLYETPEAADRGTAIHLLLQRLSQGPVADDALWQELAAHLPAEPARADFEQWLADARALLAEPALAPLFDATRYAKAWNEVPVAVDGGTALIDRLVDDGTALCIVDYKTHTRPDAAELAERYRPQLAAYVEAVKAVWPGRPVKAGLLLTATRAWVPVTGT